MARKKKESWGDAVGSAPWAKLIAPAPGDLRIVHALVNTVDPVTGTDELDSPAALREWLERWRLPAPDEGSEQAAFARIIDVRDGLRVLIAANGGAAVDADAMARLDAATENAVLRVRFDAGGGTRLEPTSRDFEGFLSGLFLIVARARSSGTWRRLKPCANPECRRAFYDASQSRNGRWCSMRRCGNKLKARTFRRRYPGYGAFAR